MKTKIKKTTRVAKRDNKIAAVCRKTQTESQARSTKQSIEMESTVQILESKLKNMESALLFKMAMIESDYVNLAWSLVGKAIKARCGFQYSGNNKMYTTITIQPHILQRIDHNIQL